MSRDSIRERDDEDPRDLSHESNSEEEVSEEVPRVVPPPSVRPLGAPAPASGPVYRSPQVTVTPSSVTRQTFATPSSPQPIQYRPSQKPTKAPRKQIVDDVAFRQPIKPPPKPVKPSQAFEIRGKKPVAQVRLIEGDQLPVYRNKLIARILRQISVSNFPTFLK